MTLVRAALTVLSAALVAPLLHLAPLPPRVDRFVASVLDGLSNNSRLVTSEKLRLAGGSLFNPEGYHGPESSSTSGSTSDGFFEGWYFKFHTADGETVVAIPGIIFAKGGGGFSFVMCAVPSATEPAQRYALHKYKLADFRHSASPNTGEWRIMIGPDGENSFGHDGFTLDLKSGGQSVKGRVELASTTPYPATLALPDVMGWFAYLPAMECRHGVVSLHSKLKGGLELNGGAITSFDGGLGYVEKDWGSQFPRTWVWLQSSHFVDPDTKAPVQATLMLSIASIPWPSEKRELTRFRGFLGCLYAPQHGGLYPFGTPTGATVESLVVSDNNSNVEVTLRSARFRLVVTASGNRDEAVLLHGPTPGGEFRPFVHEMLDASVAVELTRISDGAVVFAGEGSLGGLEIESMERGGQALLERGAG
mmetsp:Transcript_93646/g.267992  ORF Transcript_93646/g.267992 Transcript_93646/m.267992 type:complete len:421 (+) Transcript_93646:198-1460(+)